MSAQKASHEAVAGAWAGLVGTVLGYPLDVVKSRMQTAHAGAHVANATNPATSASVRPRGVPGGAGFVASFTKLAREEGLRGAYRGLGPPGGFRARRGGAMRKKFGTFCQNATHFS